MSNYDMIQENQVEMVELSDEAMEAVAGGGSNSFFSSNYISNSTIVFIFNINILGSSNYGNGDDDDDD